LQIVIVMMMRMVCQGRKPEAAFEGGGVRMGLGYWLSQPRLSTYIACKHQTDIICRDSLFPFTVSQRFPVDVIL
jgi:hypothetical protein